MLQTLFFGFFLGKKEGGALDPKKSAKKGAKKRCKKKFS